MMDVAAGLVKVPLLSSAIELFFLGIAVASQESAFKLLLQPGPKLQSEIPMRKLRRPPWRIPKSHHAQPAATAPAQTCSREELEREARRESYREALHAQPVAFTAGRYVQPRAARPAEIRRKNRHRMILPLPVLS